MEAHDPKFSDPRVVAVIGGVLAALAGLIFWWAWRQGAYFGDVFYPGAIGVFLLLAVLALAGPFEGRVRGAALLALGALAAIAGWMALSLLWTPTRGAAISYAEHAFLYVALFLVGLWLCVTLARNPTLALLPVAVGAIVTSVAVVLTLANGHDLNTYFHGEATLRLPLGYRNANAAFFLICLWPTLALAMDRARHPALRVVMIGGATALVELALLCQSRGSVPAALVAAVAWIAFSSSRLRAAAYLVLIAIPTAVAAPTLLKVFQHGELKGLGPYMHQAAGMVALTTLLALVLGTVMVLVLERRTEPSPQLQRRLGLGLGSAAVLVAVVGLVAFLVHEGGPTKFVDQRVEQFNAGGITNFSGKEARFGVNIGSNRNDFWRVSLDQAKRTPVLGGGAGSFQVTYLKHRNSPETPRDPHSVEMLLLGELGVPGLLLFVAFVVATLWAAVRSRRAGPGAALTVAGAATGVVYWTMHASYDWLWNYPVVTGTMGFLAGIAVAGSVRMASRSGDESGAAGAGSRVEPSAAGAEGASLGRGPRFGVAAAALILALVAAPLFLAERYLGRAYGEEGSDPTAAYRDFRYAANLDPFDTVALNAKGLLAARQGEGARAVDAFEQAVEREPEGYAQHLYLAELFYPEDLPAARRQIAIAAQLNPHEAVVIAARKKIDAARPTGSKKSAGRGRP
jgi:O-Antigen ligase